MREYSFRTRTAAVLLVAAAIGCLAAAPASADGVIRYGTLVRTNGSIPDGIKPVIVHFSTDRDCSLRSIAAVKAHGDVVWIKDTCYDGLQPVVRVAWRSNGKPFYRDCRNSRGAGSVVKCNWDWAEGPTKMLSSHTRNPKTGTIEYGGDSQPFYG